MGITTILQTKNSKCPISKLFRQLLQTKVTPPTHHSQPLRSPVASVISNVVEGASLRGAADVVVCVFENYGVFSRS